MTLEQLQKARITAMKQGDIFQKNVISNMIGEIQKATITAKGRIEPTEEVVNNALIKYQKTVQEMIDTCPVDRIDTRQQYENEMAIVKQYAPQLLTDEEEIKDIVLAEIEKLTAAGTTLNKGTIMKALVPIFKGKADMKIVNKIISSLV
jgi:hypothetical protein